MMRGEKKIPYAGIERTVLEDWPWAYPTYDFVIINLSTIKLLLSIITING